MSLYDTSFDDTPRLSDRDRSVQEALRGAQRRISGWFKCPCPFPKCQGKADKTLSFHGATGWYKCFRCHTKGKLDSIPGSVSEDAPTTAEQRKALDEATRPPPSFLLLGEGDGLTALSTAPARAYLRSRGLAPAMWQQARIGACLDGFLVGRVVVPVLDDGGTGWLGWSARIWEAKCDKKLKYRTPAGNWKNGVIYNHAALLEKTDEPVYLVEGVFDALAHWPHSVAVLGDVSELQIDALKESQRPVCVVLDGDAWVKGQALAWRLQFEGLMAGAVRLPPGCDPDEAPRAWLWEEAWRSLGKL